MKICYITSQTPYGNGEQFILPEVKELIKKGNEVIIIPVRPEKELASGKEPEDLKDVTIRENILDLKIFLKNILIFLLNPIKVCRIFNTIFKYSGNFNKVIKNLAILPKALYLIDIIKKHNIQHIHCHWASTPSSMGYIISSMTGIPFSITAHRWDIADNNLLIPKARQCKFIRVIDEPGYEEMIENIGEEYRDKCFKIHVGVDIKTFDNNVDEIYNEDKLNFVIAANFVEKKGHIYLIEALNMLNKKGYDFKVCFYGDGPLEEELKKKVLEFSLQDKVIFGGKIGHDILLNKYKDGEVNCFILPSIVASDGDREGIPVSLMEAMAAKIPVISTFTGGIKELVDGSTGIAIEQKDSNALAGAIESLILNKELRRNLGEEGFNRVMEEFHISKVTDKLLNLFIEN